MLHHGVERRGRHVASIVLKRIDESDVSSGHLRCGTRNYFFLRNMVCSTEHGVFHMSVRRPATRFRFVDRFGLTPFTSSKDPIAALRSRSSSRRDTVSHCRSELPPLSSIETYLNFLWQQLASRKRLSVGYFVPSCDDG